MKTSRFWFRLLRFVILLALVPPLAHGAGPRVQILSPSDGAHLAQQQNLVFVSGKVEKEAGRSAKVDIFFVIDSSGSTSQYSGSDLGDAGLPDVPDLFGPPRPQIGIGGFGLGGPSPRTLRNSILAAEVAAARRLLVQLSPASTRVGVLTFSQGAKLLQPLTHDFERVRQVLDDILRAGPYGGTNMVEGIRMGIAELMGLGTSAKRPEAVKVQMLLTDGFPTLPIGGGKQAVPEDTNLAIEAARLARRAAIKIHVFALGEEALSYPRAAVETAKESGGTYTPVTRPADVLAVVENISVVGVDHVQVVNRTTGQRATRLRLAADGYFSSAVPVTDGRNRIDVLARASDGSSGSDSITVHYVAGTQKSLDLEIFLEREKKLQVEIDRLGKSPAEIQLEVERKRRESLGSPLPPPAARP